MGSKRILPVSRVNDLGSIEDVAYRMNFPHLGDAKPAFWLDYWATQQQGGIKIEPLRKNTIVLPIPANPLIGAVLRNASAQRTQ
jgi:hypothetical protein